MKAIHPIIAHTKVEGDVFVRLLAKKDGGGVKIYDEKEKLLAEGEQFEIIHGSIFCVSKGDVVWSLEL